MFDPNLPDPFARVKAVSTPTPTNLQAMSVDQLIEMRRQIDELLPVRDLRDLDMAQEMVIQLQVVKKLQYDVQSDMDTPASARAQCANSVANAIATLSKLQDSTYTSERLKRVESVLVETLDLLPPDAQAAFIDAYEKRIRSVL